MDTTEIKRIDKFSPYLEQVNKLADLNSGTLGFLPYVVFQEYANKRWIFVALVNDKVVGYLLFRFVIKSNRVIIVHLCVDQEYRGKDIPQKLFDELRKTTVSSYGIGLWCRRDYVHANRLWEKLGFRPQSDKPGRSQKKPSELTFWWFDHGHKTLFDKFDNQKKQVAIDANIFFDFENIKNADIEIKALLSDWLQEEIEFVVTPELFNEINRNKNPHIRKKQWEKAHEYYKTEGDIDQIEAVCKILQSFFKGDLSNNSESDIKQIAHAVVDTDIHFFVSRDEELLKLSKKIFDEFQLSILRPVDLILWLDELSRIEEYKHMGIAGTKITQRRIQSQEQDLIAQNFLNTANENKNVFLQNLRKYLINPDFCTGYITESEESFLTFIIFDRSDSNELKIPILRINEKYNNKIPLLRYLLIQFLITAANENRNIVRITDPNLQSVTINALQEDVFVHVNDQWLKLALPLAASAAKIADHLDIILNEYSEISQYYKLHINILKNDSNLLNSIVMSEIERIFFPVKITNAEIPTITVPIQPHWAYRWFDEKLARQTLFGAEVDKAFNREGVYYSGAKPLNLALPGRILWYVTQGTGSFLGTQAIRACSRLDEVIVAKPKQLFQQFKHLGIYTWDNLFKLAGNDLDKELTAYRFSDTQMFTNPVIYDKWKEITLEEKGKQPPIQTAAQTTKEIFERIYKLGMDLS